MEHITVEFKPSTLAKVKGKYYVICTVPPQLKDKFGVQRRKSTGTADLKLAKIKQHNITVQIYNDFRAALKQDLFGMTKKFLQEEPDLSPNINLDDPEVREHVLLEAYYRSRRNRSVGFDSDTKAIEELEAYEGQTTEEGFVVSNKFSAIAEDYVAQTTWGSDKAKKSTQSRIEEFVGVVGDLDINKITKQHGYRFAEHLDSAGAANQTINAKISAIRGVMSWCERKGILESSPFINMSLVSYGTKSESHRPIPEATLQTLFKNEPASQEKLLLTCLLLTGARLDEWAIATYEQIKEDSGILCLDLRDAKVKNKGSRRMIPLHPAIVSVLRCEASPQSSGSSGRIFDYKVNADGKAQNAASKELMKVIRRYTKDKHHVAHSLRGNFKDLLRDLQVSKEINDTITGHSSGDVAGQYGAGASVKVRYEAICKIDASEFSLDNQ